MDESPGDDDLARRVTGLEEAIRELQDALGDEALPDPPEETPSSGPDDAARFVDEAAIPALILVLKANIRILEAIGRAIGTADTERSAERRPVVDDRTLERFDELLVELHRAVEGVSENAEVREVFEEARTLRSELDRRVRDARSAVEDAPAAGRDEDDVGTRIDIEDELESIKREHGVDEEGSGDDDAAEDGSDPVTDA